MEDTAMKTGEFRVLDPAQKAARDSQEAQKRLEMMEGLGAGGEAGGKAGGEAGGWWRGWCIWDEENLEHGQSAEVQF